jgi:penicillin-binding protein 1C
MASLTGGRSAARLARAVMMRLHGNVAGDLSDLAFPAPPGHVPVELCVYSGRRSNGECGQTLVEWVPKDAVPPLEEVVTTAAGPERPPVAVPAAHRTWAKANHLPVAEPRPEAGPVRLSIASPENNTRVWRNPDLPQGLNRLALKVVVDPPVPQVVWYVDGEPFATADPDEPVYWPVTPGAHRFEVRLPFREERSRTIRVVVD